MAKFKVGDVVRRVGYAYRDHPVGHLTTVDSVDDADGTLTCGGSGFSYDAANYIRVPRAKTALASKSPGRKDDSGKLDVTLLFDDCPHALEAIAEVLQWAITKKQPTPYARGSWQGVEPFQERYRAAMLRHVLNASKWALDTTGGLGVGLPFEEARDAETGLLELAHIATDAVFMLEMAVRKQKAQA